jgi:hypothetical protein
MGSVHKGSGAKMGDMDQPRLAAVLYGKLDEPPAMWRPACGTRCPAVRSCCCRRPRQQWNGTVVKRLGNGVLARFDSAHNAVSAAVEMQQLPRSTSDVEPNGPPSHTPWVEGARIGVSVGEIVICPEQGRRHG